METVRMENRTVTEVEGSKTIIIFPPVMDRSIRKRSRLSVSELAAKIDHTKLGPDVTLEDIKILCQQAVSYQFASVCIPPCYVKEAKLMLLGKDTPKVGTVVGFPHGSSTRDSKQMEAHNAVRDGAEEIDMVMSIGQFKSGLMKEVEKDIERVVLISYRKALVKVILECCLLTDEEIRTACLLAQNAGAHYVKTSTGFAHGGAMIDDVKLMHKTVGGRLGIKASGGIQTHEQALALINAGATRIGASASISILEGMNHD